MKQYQFNDFPYLISKECLTSREMQVLQELTKDRSKIKYPALICSPCGVKRTIVVSLSEQAILQMAYERKTELAIKETQEALEPRYQCLKIGPVAFLEFSVTVHNGMKKVSHHSLWLSLEDVLWLVKFAWFDEYNFEAIQSLRKDIYVKIKESLGASYNKNSLVILSSAEQTLMNLYIYDEMYSSEVAYEEHQERHVVVTATDQYVLIRMESYEGDDIIDEGELYFFEEDKASLCSGIGAYRNAGIWRSLKKFYEGIPLKKETVFGGSKT